MKIQVLAAVGLTLLFAGCDDSSTVRDSVAVVETDYNNDGIVDQTATLTYSGTTGQLLTQEWDYADPTAEDVLVTYEYDENGFKSREEMANVSDDSVILVVTQINDERGNALEVRYDYDNDGIANRIDYKSYSLDDDMTREAYDFNADGTINRERLYTFASAGQFATRSFDDNGDGVYEYYETVDYEPGNRREIRFLIDRNGDRNFDEEYFASWTAQPPDRELAQPVERVGRREGHAVVGPDDSRQAKFLKGPFEAGKREFLLRRRQRLARQQIAAGEIGDGQRIAVAPIAEHELAFVVGAPQSIRLGRL